MNKFVNPFFSLRAAAIIQRNNRFLFCKNDNHDVYYLIGGGIEPGESSEEAVLRELYEETGYHFEIDRLIYVQERFYTAKNIPHHEITFFYLMKENIFSISDGGNTDRNDEHLKWVSLDELHKFKVVPPFIRSALSSLPIHLTHIITHS